ncbi:MAG TPA: acyl-ACP--UDP-N-acetylglucosamine O-acyltransferase [candidate division Zixibacteria bacterium]|nr:acyl-ACP--UDP-N-acetylglucosamine O-acyltransferase [candidate division Zixibacteria bacterium]
MSNIHPTAVVSPKAELDPTVKVGPYTIIEDDVTIGKGTEIVSSSRIAAGAVLGENVRVFHGAVIGTIPQDLKFGGEKTRVVIGDGTTIREYATINRGTAAHGESSIGKNCFLMAYSHVAHDCIIGDNVIMANSVNLAGHIEVGDYAILGGVLPVHQFVKIGAHAMIGGGYRVQQDVCPYALVAGYPLKVVGINAIGLKRRGFKLETVRTLERVFKILFFSKLNTTQAVERIHSEMEIIPEVQEILSFLDRSNRGIVK